MDSDVWRILSLSFSSDLKTIRTPIIQNNIAGIIHVMAWLLFGFALLIHPAITWTIEIPKEFWAKQILLLVLMACIYTANANLVSRLLVHNRFTAYSLLVILMITGVQVFSLIFDVFTSLPSLLKTAWGLKSVPTAFHLDIFALISTVMIIGISTSVRMFRYWQANSEQKEQSEKQHLNAELLFLKSQINPHFFFNTLNTIYSLSFHDVEHSRDALLKLSKMMRYALYKHEDDETLISDEITFIRNYVELMKLRLRKPSSVILTITEIAEQAHIAPMLLIPFIENAFKYGAGCEEDGAIQIEVKQTSTHFYLMVRNAIFKPEETIQKNAVGIANTTRRLNLLYPGCHTLHYGRSAGNSYNVNLEIEIG